MHIGHHIMAGADPVYGGAKHGDPIFFGDIKSLFSYVGGVAEDGGADADEGEVAAGLGVEAAEGGVCVEVAAAVVDADDGVGRAELGGGLFGFVDRFDHLVGGGCAAAEAGE